MLRTGVPLGARSVEVLVVPSGVSPEIGVEAKTKGGWKVKTKTTNKVVTLEVIALEVIALAIILQKRKRAMLREALKIDTGYL